MVIMTVYRYHCFHSDIGGNNAMSISVDTTFSPEDHSLPKTGIVGMKNSSASMEALVSNKMKVSAMCVFGSFKCSNVLG